MEKIGEGAEAKIYCAKVYGMDVILKSRGPKAYRLQELDLRIRRQRTKREAKLMKRAADSGLSVPKIIAVGDTVIFMQMIKGKLLKDTKITSSKASSIGDLLAKLHNLGIAHGDFTPANLISSGKELYLIDFGLADSTISSEEKALDMLLMKRQLEPSLYKQFISGYSKSSKSSREIIARLAEIEERGRYQSRTLG